MSVATSHTEYYPLYLSNGVVHNNVRRSRRNALTLVAFLAIPKSMFISFYVVFTPVNVQYSIDS